MEAEVDAVKYDPHKEAEIAEAFEDIGDALMQLLAASQQHDWEVRHRAAEHLGQAAVKVYRTLTQEGAHPVG